MSHIPSSAMKHAHNAPEEHQQPAPVQRAKAAAEHVSVPLWTSIAAGVAGAVGLALILSLRSSAPAPKHKPGARKGSRKPKS